MIAVVEQAPDDELDRIIKEQVERMVESEQKAGFAGATAEQRTIMADYLRNHHRPKTLLGGKFITGEGLRAKQSQKRVLRRWRRAGSGASPAYAWSSVMRAKQVSQLLRSEQAHPAAKAAVV
jgi:hypothetical protein